MSKRIRLTEASVRACFEQQAQADVLIALYRLVFPDFDAIDHLDGWPSMSIQGVRVHSKQAVA